MRVRWLKLQCWQWSILLIFCMALLWAAPSVEAKSVDVKGYGFFENFRLRNFLREIDPEPEAETFSPEFVEDGFFLINAQLQRAGHLEPTIRADYVTEDGMEGVSRWTQRRSEGLPELPVESVRFEIESGLLYYFGGLEIEGLTLISEREAIAFFYPSGFLINRRAFRPYSPDRVSRGQSSLIRRLQMLGHREVRVEVVGQEIDHGTGEVRVALEVFEGPLYRVGRITERLSATAMEPSAETAALIVPSRDHEAVFSADLERDFATGTRNRFFREGYPDAFVRSGYEALGVEDGAVMVDVRLVVTPGERARLGETAFEGFRMTRERYAKCIFELQEGDRLDRMALEEARFNLARLGVFRNVHYEIEPERNGARDVVISVEEESRHELSLIGGWGSYERLRVGFEYSILNLWGRAHQSDLTVLQTFKGTAGSYVYRIPFVRQAPVSLYFRLAALRREEVAFRGEELTFEPGVEYRHPGTDHRLALRYRFQRLESIFPDDAERPGLESARVGSLTLEWSLDRRDIAIAPSSGYRLAASAEFADRWLGANTTYQRFLWRATYHYEVLIGSRVHARLEQGAFTYWGGVRGETPFNRRFFPGGENTVRGFREGGASPRDFLGEIVGAEVYTLGTLEWEQSLTPSLSAVLFTDAILGSEHVGDYPGDTLIVSSGLGLRYSTPLGPLRIEYGRNLERRDGDRRAALHLSLGFPF